MATSTSLRGSTLGNRPFLACYILINTSFSFYLLIKTSGPARIAAHTIQNLTVFDMLSSYMLLSMSLTFATSLDLTLVIKSESEEKTVSPGFNSNSIILAASLVVMISLTCNQFDYKLYQASLNINISQTGQSR